MHIRILPNIQQIKLLVSNHCFKSSVTLEYCFVFDNLIGYWGYFEILLAFAIKYPKGDEWIET